MSAASTVAGPDPAIPSRHRRLVLAVVCASTLVVVGLVAAVNLALPALSSDPLRPGAADVLWIVDLYVVVFACLVIPGGAMGDRYGNRRVLVLGLAVFGLGGLVAAVAPTLPVLLAARALSGVGAALVLPNCLGVLLQATPPQRRTAAVAAWATSTGLGGIVGNIGGAAVVVSLSWRGLFLVAGAVGAVCAVLVRVSVGRSARHSRRLDPVGAVLLTAAILALFVGIIEGPGRGWTDALVLGALAASGILFAAWMRVALRSPSPLLDPRVFRIPAVSGAGLGLGIAFFGCFALFYVNASLLQYLRGFSPLLAGVATLPLAVPILAGTRVLPRLAARLGPPFTLALAFAAIAAGLGILGTTVTAPYLVYAVGLVVLGVGFALALPTLTADLTAALPADRAGLAGGLQAATRELGSGLGVAVVGTTLTSAFVDRLPHGVRTLSPVPRTVADALARVPGARSGILSAYAQGAEVALLACGATMVVAGAAVVAVTAVSRRAGRPR